MMKLKTVFSAFCLGSVALVATPAMANNQAVIVQLHQQIEQVQNEMHAGLDKQNKSTQTALMQQHVVMQAQLAKIHKQMQQVQSNLNTKIDALQKNIQSELVQLNKAHH